MLASTILLASCGGDGSGADAGNPSGTFTSDCRIRFVMTSGQLIDTFQAIFDYSRAPGHFVGVNTNVQCTRLDDRAGIVGANQCTGPNGSCLATDPHELYVTAQTTRPISSPLDLLDCRFIGAEPPAVEEFELVAVYTDGIASPPVLEVTEIECEPLVTTTSTLPAPDPCDEIECAANEACVDGACVATNHYQIEFQSDRAADFGSLQVDAHYDCTQGGLDGLGDQVECSTVPTINVFAAFHDHECQAPASDARLAAGVISLVGWQGPGPYLTCEYTSLTGEPPTAETFDIDVVDATDVEGNTLNGVTVSVSAIRPLAP